MSTRRALQREAKKLKPPKQAPPAPLFSSGGDFTDCPFCEAAGNETGPLGCCGAITTNCEGSVDGAPTRDLEGGDPRWERREVHFWYADTGERAPHEWEDDGVSCRCGT